MHMFELFRQRIKNYNTKRKVMKVLSDVKQFSKDQCEKAAQIILMVREKGSVLESIIHKECPVEIRKPLEKELILVYENGKCSLGRYINRIISGYTKTHNIAYAPFMRTF